MRKLYAVIIRILRRYVCIAEPRESGIVVRQHRHYRLMRQTDEVVTYESGTFCLELGRIAFGRHVGARNLRWKESLPRGRAQWSCKEVTIAVNSDQFPFCSFPCDAAKGVGATRVYRSYQLRSLWAAKSNGTAGISGFCARGNKRLVNELVLLPQDMMWDMK